VTAHIDTDQYITVMQAAKKLGLSRQRTYVLIRQGRLDAYLVAGRWLVNEENLTIKPPQGRRNET